MVKKSTLKGLLIVGTVGLAGLIFSECSDSECKSLVNGTGIVQVKADEYTTDYQGKSVRIKSPIFYNIYCLEGKQVSLSEYRRKIGF